MLYVGIDNGVSGHIVVLDESRNAIASIPAQTVVVEGVTRSWRKLCPYLTTSVLSPFASQGACFIIEKAAPVSGSMRGSIATFMAGYSDAMYVSILAALGVPDKRVVSVPARLWQKTLLGATHGDSKNLSISFALSEVPAISLMRTARSRKHDSNIADATCLAMYGVLHVQC
jgi:hypothetical protein